MRFLRQFTCIVLLALWLPATSHCALESANLLPPEDCCAEQEDHCATDGCQDIESNLVKPSAECAVAKPALVALEFLMGGPADVPVLAQFATFVSSAWSQPADWLTTWNFEHRLALPARAPSSC